MGAATASSLCSRTRSTPSTVPSRSSSVSPKQRDVDDLVPEIRIGVHEADALMCGNDFAGLGVHEAARIGAYADAGSILASASTAAAAGAPTVAPERKVAFKGLGDRIAIQEIQWRAGT